MTPHAQPVASEAVEVKLRVLYLFAGPDRQSSLGHALCEEAALRAAATPGIRIQVVLEEIDTLRGGRDHDALNPALQDSLDQKVSQGHYDLVIVTPPCNTFTRSVFANRRGPAPVRDWQWPRGFPWLTPARRAAAEGGNALVDLAV